MVCALLAWLPPWCFHMAESTFCPLECELSRMVALFRYCGVERGGGYGTGTTRSEGRYTIWSVIVGPRIVPFRFVFLFFRPEAAAAETAELRCTNLFLGVPRATPHRPLAMMARWLVVDVFSLAFKICNPPGRWRRGTTVPVVQAGIRCNALMLKDCAPRMDRSNARVNTVSQ